MSLTLAGDGEITGFDAAASGFGGLVAVKHVVKTDAFSASVAAGASTTITGLSISHAAADASHVVYLFGQITGINGSNQALATFLTADGTAVDVGDAASSRPRIGGSNRSGSASYSNSVTLLGKYAPASTSSVTYAASILNNINTTATVYANRTTTDGDDEFGTRSASAIILMEVKV